MDIVVSINSPNATLTLVLSEKNKVKNSWISQWIFELKGKIIQLSSASTGKDFSTIFPLKDWANFTAFRIEVMRVMGKYAWEIINIILLAIVVVVGIVEIVVLVLVLVVVDAKLKLISCLSYKKLFSQYVYLTGCSFTCRRSCWHNRTCITCAGRQCHWCLTRIDSINNRFNFKSSFFLFSAPENNFC